MGKRTRYSPEFKAKVALDAIRGEQTLAELSTKHGVHPNLINEWKNQAIEQMSSLFGGGGAEAVKEKEAEVEKLHAKIGQLPVERDFFSESLRTMSTDRRLRMIDKDHARLSLRRQCRLLSLSRSSLYYTPVGESAENLA